MATFPSLSSSFPDEIITEILSRLPVESLILFKSVCKSWFSLIESSDFISMHLHGHSNNNDNDLLVFQSNVSISCSCTLIFFQGEDGANQSMNLFTFPGQDPVNHPNLTLLGSGNGLVCISLSRSHYDVFYLFNPATRQFRLLPRPFLPSTEGDYFDYENNCSIILARSFGFCPHINDYFIILVLAEWGPFDNKAEIWRSSTDSWKEIEIIPDFYIGHDFEREPVMVKGSWYSLLFACGINDNGIYDDVIILCFNVVGEIFSKMEIPDLSTVEESWRNEMQLMVYKDLLAFVLEYESSEHFDIWVMKDDSWTKVLTMGPFIKRMDLLGCWNNTNKFILREHEFCNSTGNLYEYDPSTQNLRVFSEDHGVRSMAHKYVKSLVSVYPI